ncbi:flavin-containing monooxygenase [Novosphingobium pentaromativorans]|uniref:Cyclododecanone monooxygenase n=1 Tax=Novosphingobium pentaromativorans US6-1 TaxID=1088721 RepID=G6E7Y5_9SPHN|nr:NAD(P)/FAD-dependent oxidoreductase [Novosphingobium pentaromativorans]AIT81498.1 monooxygenase [Novosphingobium pentaromativorans US6-1]EHJ62628.1 cyclododecanone monooxygenase [Novosphingobium pentaromativorans US6-1]
MATDTSTLGFDPEELRAKYRAERDKRLREEGNAQYVPIKGEYASFADDPYVDPGFTREPVTDETDVVIIGGGFGGMLAGARLRQAGVKDIRIIEKAGDVGGTWYWNRYPGIACDIESYTYLPLLEETGYIPEGNYATGPEILEHHRRIARQFDLYDGALFQTVVKSMEWDEASNRWIIRTDRDDAIRARFLVLGSGPMSMLKLPGIPGIDKFKGKMFHTARWDYDYTGGDSTGGLTKLGDKRVGIIGTGATAVQVVPHVGAAAEHLYVFQRTPSSVGPRNERHTDPEWVKSLEPGWHQRRMDNFNALTTGVPVKEDLVNDNWTDIFRAVFGAAVDENGNPRSPEEMARIVELQDMKKMEEIRQRVSDIVKDPATAEALKPYYDFFCKRPCIHDEYLPTFNRSNVTLVDTNGMGVDALTEDSVVVGDKSYRIDCLIFATGFEVLAKLTDRNGYDITGRGGVKLSEYFVNGMRSLHGMLVHNFPNMFNMGLLQSAFSNNYPHMLNEQAKHIAYIASQVMERQKTRVEVTKEAEEAWVDEIKSKAGMRDKFLAECTPGYYNNEGKANPLAHQNSTYGAGPVPFIKIIEAWREDGDMKGLAVS